MGFFDPARKQIVDKSPPQFAGLASITMSMIEADVWPQMKNHIKREDYATAALAALAMAAHRQEGTWSSKSLKYIEGAGDGALMNLSRAEADHVKSLVDHVWGNFRFLLQPETEEGE